MKAKARILLVEDKSIIADSMEQMLRVSGYEVTSIVDSGEAAVQIAGEDPPDVGLLDVKLAGKIDGIEAAKQIRASRDIPVIYLTAHSDKNLIDRAKITEPFGYLLKPIDERELCATIEMTLYKHKLEMELKETNRRLKQEIAERERVEKEFKQYRDHLEELVEERAAELVETNKQLQREITERRQAEEALQESEKRFRSLVENQGEGVGIVDPEEQFTFANPAADRIFGVPLLMMGSDLILQRSKVRDGA